jgi:hypothetical protein
MVAVILVMLGVGFDGPKAKAAPILDSGKKKDLPGDELPAAVTSMVVTQWMVLQRSSAPWIRLKQHVTVLLAGDPKAISVTSLKRDLHGAPPRLQALLLADLEARAAGKAVPAVTAGQLVAALDEAEQAGYFDHWLGAYLWRRSDAVADGRARLDLYTRLYRHARVTDTLIRAHARLKPIMVSPSAWMGKGGPTKSDREAMVAYLKSMDDMAANVKALYPSTDAGTWKRDALVVVSVSKGASGLTLHCGGRKVWPEADEKVRFGRLDLFETAEKSEVVLEHAWLGKIALPPGSVVSTWDLPKYLSDEAKKKVRKAVVDALDGDEKAAEQLELALPLAQPFIREGLAETPKAKAAPRLRMILTLFDDALMPALPDAATSEDALLRGQTRAR